MRRLLFAAAMLCAAHAAARDTPGAIEGGRSLLPNGWMLSPAGKSSECGEFPLNMRLSPNGAMIAIMNAGVSGAFVRVFDVHAQTISPPLTLPNGWLGLYWADNERLFVSGGNAGCVYECKIHRGTLSLADSIRIGERPGVSVAGIDGDSAYLYAASKGDSALYVVDIRQRNSVARIALDNDCYTALRSARFPYVFVSEWGGPFVDVIDAHTLKKIKQIPVGYHPSAMAEDARSGRLFVACSGDNAVSIVSEPDFTVKQRLSTSPFPGKLPGSMPNALALSPDETLLYVANGGNNALVVYSVADSRHLGVIGWIPTGWFPDAVIGTKTQLYVLNAKGDGVPAKDMIASPGACIRYEGTLETIPMPTLQNLRNYTEEILRDMPYFSRKNGKTCSGSPIPDSAGVPSPIKYVFYIVKGASSYDQTLGDVAEGDGDKRLCEFPENATPNIHALAREFVLLDNFYAEGDSPADGVNWSLGAWSNDFIDKCMTAYYGGRKESWKFTGQTNLSLPQVGYLWDYCDWKGKRVRVYGAFTERQNDSIAEPAAAEKVNLFGMTDEGYPADVPGISDSVRLCKWKQEFDLFVLHQVLPTLSIIRLPCDYASDGAADSNASVKAAAESDYALGKIVETISHSPFWNESAIFIVESCAGGAPDHVDFRRAVALVVSPYAKRHAVDHTMYSTSSVLKTIEHIVGVPSMSQYDESAGLMCNSFTMQPDTAPYTAHSRQRRAGLRKQ